MNAGTLQSRRHVISAKAIFLFLLALLGPSVSGLQYIWWDLTSSSHLTCVFYSPFWSLTYSDFYDFLLVFRSFGLPSSSITAPHFISQYLVLHILARFIFACGTIACIQGDLSKKGLLLFGILALVSSLLVCIEYMMSSGIFGIPPNTLMSFYQHDFEFKLFLPVPILELSAIWLIRKRARLI